MFLSRRKFLGYLTVVSALLTSRRVIAERNKLVLGSREYSRAVVIGKTNIFDSGLLRVSENSIENQNFGNSGESNQLTEDTQITDNEIQVDSADSANAADLILNQQQLVVLDSVVKRVKRLREYVGFGNFNIISWDKSLRLAANNPEIGSFSSSEIELFECLFYLDAKRMGFFGDRVISQISSTISTSEIEKIPWTGHFLFKGKSLNTYNKIRNDIGESIVLTSGVRNVVKQMYLFLVKTMALGGNLSGASLSVAPPGYSFHAVGDFDVGKVDFGYRNFTTEFASTDEFKRLSELDYIQLRYPLDNAFGVRFEPWHIKVVKSHAIFCD